MEAAGARGNLFQPWKTRRAPATRDLQDGSASSVCWNQAGANAKNQSAFSAKPLPSSSSTKT